MNTPQLNGSSFSLVLSRATSTGFDLPLPVRGRAPLTIKPHRPLTGATGSTPFTCVSSTPQLTYEFDTNMLLVFLSEKTANAVITAGGVVGDKPDDNLEWRSACESGACLEIAAVDEIIVMRVSTTKDATVTMTRAEWEVFVNAAKNGRFDDV